MLSTNDKFCKHEHWWKKKLHFNKYDFFNIEMEIDTCI